MNTEHRQIYPGSINNDHKWRHDQSTEEVPRWRMMFWGLFQRRGPLDMSEIFHRERLDLTFSHKLMLASHVVCLLAVLATFAAPYWINMTFEDTEEQLHVGIMMKCYTDIEHRHIHYAKPGCSFLWLDGFQGRLPYWVNLARYEVMSALYLMVVTLLVDFIVFVRRDDFRWLLVPGVLCVHAGALIFAAVGIVTSQVDTYAFHEFSPEPLVTRGWTLYLAVATGGLLVLSSSLSLFTMKGNIKRKEPTMKLEPPVYDAPATYIPYHII